MQAQGSLPGVCVCFEGEEKGVTVPPEVPASLIFELIPLAAEAFRLCMSVTGQNMSKQVLKDVGPELDSVHRG